MNKTININLGGIFFHIDEQAFIKLKHYLDAISNSLNDDPQGKEEIIKDIEQRISELLSEKISEERQVINQANIDEVIAVMGQPEDYIYDDELFHESQPRKSRSKKLYRDGKDKILGGVSSGLGYYLGIDTAWVRILWIIITLLFGTGIFAYIILWIILPEANTTTEELEMTGQPVNIDNIEKKIKEGYTKVRDADYSNVKSGFQDFLDTIGTILLTLLKILGKFIGILLIIVAASTLIGLVIAFLFWGGSEIIGFGGDIPQIPFFNESALLPSWLLILLSFFAISIPFVFLFILGINILSKTKKSIGLTGNLSLLGVWILSLIGMAFAGIEYENKYATKAAISENFEYNVLAKDTLHINMIGNDLIANRKSLYRSSNLEFVEDSLGNEKLFSSYVHVDVRQSSTDQVIVKVIKSTRAFNKNKAKENAGLISYNFIENENTLDLDAYFLVPKELENNRPKIDVIIYVPEDRNVYLDNTTKSFLYDVKNKTNIYDSDMANHYFLMGPEGFVCTDCPLDEDTDSFDSDDEEGVNLDINTDGVQLKINDGKKQVDVTIDEDGIEVK